MGRESLGLATRGSIHLFARKQEIAAHLLNATHVHVTGTGQAQEQFIRFLADTPQYKNVKAAQSTANKMSDEKLIGFIAGKL